MSTAPSRWGMGTQWGTAAADPIEAFWGPVAAPATRPVVYVSINNILQPTVTAASWRLGRDGWFSDLTPSSASISFSEPATGTNGDQVIIATETGLLWTGVLENISTTKRLEGGYTSAVTCVDGLGRHGLAKMTTALSYGGETLVTLIERVMAALGLDPITIVVGDSATSLPTLSSAVSTLDRTLLEYIQLAEKSSNALMTLQPDGSLLVVTRDALVATDVAVLDLVGINAPRAWTVATDKSSVINHWSLVDDLDVNRLEETDAASVLRYGEVTYAITDYMDTSATHFTADMRAFVAIPRPVVQSGEFPIHDQTQAVIHLSPLDWVSFDGDTWQVMSVEHNVSPNDWSMTITADVSQNAMAAVPEPTPVEPGPVTVDTQTLTSTKSATVVKSSSGTFLGNGAGNYLPVGLYSGFRHRALIDFTTLSKPAGFISVKKATLNLRTTGQQWVAFGSKPKFYARRITESWSEGTYDAAPKNQYSTTNAVVWPGPSKTTSGQTLKSISDSENNDISVDVTDILQAVLGSGPASGFYGVMLISANEDSSNGTIEFFSDDEGTASRRPELVVQCYTSP